VIGRDGKFWAIAVVVMSEAKAAADVSASVTRVSSFIVRSLSSCFVVMAGVERPALSSGGIVLEFPSSQTGFS
jgi:hypothetical protein